VAVTNVVPAATTAVVFVAVAAVFVAAAAVAFVAAATAAVIVFGLVLAADAVVAVTEIGAAGALGTVFVAGLLL
jgi:hypothetical protein